MKHIPSLMFAVFAFSSCGRIDMPFAQGGAAAGGFDNVEPAKVPVVAGCQIFPANNPWNTDISKYPLDPRSSQYIAALPG